MGLKLEFRKHTLKFKFDAGTSRGVLKTKDAWIIKVYSEGNRTIFGLGEVSVIDRLSFDFQLDFSLELGLLAERMVHYSVPQSAQEVYQLTTKLVPVTQPAIRFGLETALLGLVNEDPFRIFNNGFIDHKKSIPINGLIWMGDEAFMKAQIDQKLKEGFRCIKLKIGAIDFEAECGMLAYIRSLYSAEVLTLRVDANGAFRTEDVLAKLKRLSEFDLHSIEQPIMPRQTTAMSLVCEKSPIPVALDEELIGVFDIKDKAQLLRDINPSYIILKPALLGGLHATDEWIKLAESMEIGWWVTSALESNIGLNAICQFTAQYETDRYQGLGTGKLFENNFHSPLQIVGESILYNSNLSWDYSTLDF